MLICKTGLLFVLVSGVFSCKATKKDTSDVKLIGGQVAAENQYPATIHLAMPDANGNAINYCTGSFISKTHILTAAHCVIEPNEILGAGVEVDFKSRLKGGVLFYYHGAASQQGYQTSLKNVYIPKETVTFLKKAKDWNAGGTELAHDVAVLEVDAFQDPNIQIATLSSKQVKAGTAFRFGGYGCEKNALIPSTASAAGSTGRRLKVAQGKVSKVTKLVAYGPKYEGPAKQSACPGDSGGPIYFDASPEDALASMKDVIGVISFIALEEGAKTEVNFSLITRNSKLGKWVLDAVAGTVEPFHAPSDD